MDIQNLIKGDILKNIDSYSEKLSISKVITFFERQGVFFTKTMIQNYLRVGVIPPLFEKRYYKKKHIIFLYLVYNLKDVFSLQFINNLVTPLFKLDSDELMKIYKVFINIYNTTLEQENQNLKNYLIDKNKNEDLNNQISVLILASKAISINHLILENDTVKIC